MLHRRNPVPIELRHAAWCHRAAPAAAQRQHGHNRIAPADSRQCAGRLVSMIAANLQ
ncbi:hypothetical protein D3C84_359850 [compost metagenome]